MHEEGVPVTSSLDYLREGFCLLGHPELRWFVVIPLLLNATIFGGLSWLSVHWLGSLIESLVAWLPEWLQWLSWVMWPVAVVLVLVVAMYSFSTLANLLASPFNGLLAEKAEELLTGAPVQGKETVWGAILQAPRVFLKELHKLGYQLYWVVPLVVVSLIPGVNLLAPWLWFGFSAWMTALEYCDYAMDNHRFSFPEVRSQVATQRWPCFSFGALVMLGNLVPLLNLVIMPAAVCGATLLWVERLRAEALAGREPG